jgi:hypothetical protein
VSLADEDGVTWEQALDFTLLEMRVGALPWHFEDAVMLRERERLAPSFRDHHELWPVVRNKVLRLARYQGAVAALVQEIVDGPETGPAFVTFESLQVGAWFVQLACPSEKPPSLLTGKHLPDSGSSGAAAVDRPATALSAPADRESVRVGGTARLSRPSARACGQKALQVVEQDRGRRRALPAVGTQAARQKRRHVLVVSG